MLASASPTPVGQLRYSSTLCARGCGPHSTTVFLWFRLLVVIEDLVSWQSLSFAAKARFLYFTCRKDRGIYSCVTIMTVVTAHQKRVNVHQQHTWSVCHFCVCVITQLTVMVISGQGKTQLIRLQVRMINSAWYRSLLGWWGMVNSEVEWTRKAEIDVEFLPEGRVHWAMISEVWDYCNLVIPVPVL